MITYAADGKPNPIEPHQREWALLLIFALVG
jgi:hypothetical protein